MRLATRFFLATSALVTVSVATLTVAADRLLRRQLTTELESSLEGEARLVATLIPPDSVGWPDAALRIGGVFGRRVTLIDPTGRVRGDADFPLEALPHLENHLSRPEVQQALAQGIGSYQRLSASTNERQLYVAFRGGPAGLAIVRVSAPLASVDAAVSEAERAIVAVGLVAILAAALIAWITGHSLSRPLVELATTARVIAAEGEPEFPDSRVREVADHIRALRAMHEQLQGRFAELRRETEESRTLVESMTDGVIAADSAGRIGTANAAARDAWMPFAEAAADRGVTFDAKVPASLSIAVDPDALRQILSNLYDNALRHTPRGGSITFSAAPAGDGVVIEVRDTGSGIGAEHLPRIFERFYRADPARSRDQGGTGLGLSIVKHLVEAHGGRVTAESTPGRGTTIRFVLPPPLSVTQS